MRVYRHLTWEQILSTGILVIVICSCMYIFVSTFFEQSAYDMMARLSANKTGSKDIINIVIDEESIEEIGSWPWNRTIYTDMFEYLNNAGAKAIVFDAILTSQTTSPSDAEFIKKIKNINNLTVGIDFSKNENVKNSDAELQYFAEKFSINLTDNRNINFIQKTAYNAYQQMLPGYINEIKSIGAVNTTLDTDGVVRAFEPFIYMHGKYYPSLSLAAYIKLKDITQFIIYDEFYEAISKDGTTYKFPLKKTNYQSVQYIKWLSSYNKASWAAHEQIKAIDIVKSYQAIKKGETPPISPLLFKNKIIVIGATANALLDLKITPTSINMPDSAVQATILDNLLSEDSIKIAPTITSILIMCTFIAVIIALIFCLSPALSIISILLLCFLYFYLTLYTYTKGIAINITAPYIFFILTAIFAYSYKFSIEDYKKEKLKRAMKQYINTTVVDNIIRQDDEVKLGGQKTELTILIADMRGFTRFSENLDPDEVTKLLNEYFSLMIPIIEQYGGVVNKFIGDAILAVFNEPIKDKRHPINAIYCATKMLATAKELRKKWKSENKPDIGISIGINTGMAFIGNIGTPNHLEYTVIGDTVNVASRIEAQNRQFNTQILISESTYEYAKDILDVIKISSVEIRGREKHMNIYEIIKILDNNETN